MNNPPKVFSRRTINFIERTDKALGIAMALGGDSMTDTINRAVQAYAWLLHEIHQGGEVQVKQADGTVQAVKFLGKKEA